MNAQPNRRTVVVGVDGSDNALRAVQWGAAEAARRHVPLRLVHAFAWNPDHVAGYPGPGEQYRQILLDRAGAAVAAAAALAHQGHPDLEIEQQVIAGSPIGVLSGEARRAQLVVVGDRGLSRIEGLLSGSVAVALTSHGDCPAVVVRGPSQDPATTASLPVVVGIDGSPTSEAAIAFAYEAAATRGVPLVAVHAWQDLMTDPTYAPLIDWDAVERDERQLLAERLAGWAEKYPDVGVHRLVTRGRPARALLDQADNAQLLVVGSRGRGEFTGLALGSVSNAVVHRAACPVAVVRPDVVERA